LSDYTETHPALRRRALVLVACMLATFMAAIEATIVATAMPTIVAGLGSFALLGWVFAVYLLAQAVSIPIYGRLADLLGRKRVFFFGASLFLLGSTLCGFASSMMALVVFRALQGLGAGAIVPIATTIVGDIYSPEERAGVQGYLMSVWGVSAIIGPLLGAFIVQHFAWSFIFWLNLPVGAASMALLSWCLPESRASAAPKLDIAGAVLLTGGVITLLLIVLQSAHLDGWVVVLLAFASAGFFMLLVRQERRAPEPLFPLALWHSRVLVSGAAGSLMVGAAMMGTSAFLPTYIQGVMGGSALDAGITLTLMSVSWSLAGAFVGRAIQATSYRAMAIAGGGALVLGSLVLPVLAPGGGLAWAWVSAFLIGAGMGLSNTTFLLAVQNSAGRSMRGIATASTTFMRMLGSSLGTALLAAVLNLGLAYGLPGVADPVQALMDPRRREGFSPDELAHLADRVASALHGVFWTACLFGLAAMVLARFVPREVRASSLGAATRDRSSTRSRV
jgi:EmrB/QacA subfamily drug resistance transporter